jgi:VWFA-related protein
MLRTMFGVAIAGTLLLPWQQSQPPTIRARADLVEVDVVVVDAGGNAVRGLTAGDFVLKDRGTPQAIATLDEVAHEPRVPSLAAAPLPLVRKDVSDNQVAQADRLVVMVVDDLHIYKDRTDTSRTIARQVLETLGRDSSMAVLFTSGEHSTQVTDDQAVLAAAVDSLKGRQSWRRPHPAVDAQTGPVVGAEDSMEAAFAKVQQAQDTKVQDFFDNMSQYKLLQDAAKLLGGNDRRRKAFVLISEGIGKDLSGIFGAMAPAGQPPEGGAAYAAGDVAGLTRTAPVPYHEIALVDMMESLRRSNVATYAIDPRGKVESKDLARECFPAPKPGNDPCSEGLTEWVSPVRQAQHGLEIMSQASGGFAVTNSDDFTSGLTRIVSDLDHYYLLGFYPSDPKGKGYRPLDVTVPGRAGLTLRFRHGYMPERVRDTSAAVKKGGEMVALSSGILPRSDLPLKLAALPMPGSGSTARVALVLEVSVPRVALEEKDGRLHDRVKYEVLVVDEKKARVRSLAGLEAAFTLAGNASMGPAPDVATYQITDSVDVAPGHYEFRVSATSAKMSRGGSVYLPVDVPDFQREVAIGGVAIGYADGPRVPLAPRRVAPARAAAKMAGDPRPPLPISPSLERVFVATDTLRVYVEGTARSSAGRVMAAVDVVDATGKVVRSPSPSFLTTDIVRIESVIPLSGLAPGPYVLRATLSAGARPPAVREVGFAVK